MKAPGRIKAMKFIGVDGCKTSCVFPPSCREALAAEIYEEACEINKKILGKKISFQTWHISNGNCFLPIDSLDRI
jgi:hypothetical protein